MGNKKAIQALRKEKAKRKAEKAMLKLGETHRRMGVDPPHSIAVWRERRELDAGSTDFPISDWSKCLKQAKNEDYLFTVRLGFDQAVTTDGSGAYAGVVSDSPVQAQNWTNYAAVFDQARVLCYKVHFEPYWTVNCTFAPIASVVDRSDATALTGYGLAERYSSHRKTPGQKPNRQTVNMSGVGDSEFFSTSSPVARHWVKFYTSGNTASFTMGRMNVELLVQFRGVGIN
jgi:hypothetical protein